MHARRIKTKGSPEQVEKARQVIDGTVIPSAKEMPGFAGGYWLTDRNSGEGLTLIFYDTKEHLQATAERAAQLRADATKQIGAEVQGVHEFEVVLDTGKKVHSGATHARYVEFEPGPGRAREIVRNLEENVLPNVQKLPGFVGGFWAADLDNGVGFGVTLFDSHANLVASRGAVKDIAQRGQERMGGAPPQVAEYEILARAETPATAAIG